MVVVADARNVALFNHVCPYIETFALLELVDEILQVLLGLRAPLSGGASVGSISLAGWSLQSVPCVRVVSPVEGARRSSFEC